jgi:hypothetical protein
MRSANTLISLWNGRRDHGVRCLRLQRRKKYAFPESPLKRAALALALGSPGIYFFFYILINRLIYRAHPFHLPADFFAATACLAFILPLVALPVCFFERKERFLENPHTWSSYPAEFLNPLNWDRTTLWLSLFFLSMLYSYQASTEEVPITGDGWRQLTIVIALMIATLFLQFTFVRFFPRLYMRNLFTFSIFCILVLEIGAIGWL